jgi:hypothetical protein
MSKLTNCPNCGAKWSYEEQETDSCDSCEYPVFAAAPIPPADTEKCSGNCGMSYCDDNGCLEKKHILAEGVIPLKHPDDEKR